MYEQNSVKILYLRKVLFSSYFKFCDRISWSKLFKGKNIKILEDDIPKSKTKDYTSESRIYSALFFILCKAITTILQIQNSPSPTNSKMWSAFIVRLILQGIYICKVVWITVNQFRVRKPETKFQPQIIIFLKL